MADTNRIDFLSNSAAATSSDFGWQGGWLAFIAEATWSGGSAKLQFQTPHSTWIDVPSGSLSANGMLMLQLPPTRLRCVAATGSAFYAWGVGIPTKTRG